jgi:hypothetical protein
MPAVRAQIAISKPGDAYEREADQVADRVLGMPEPAATAGEPPWLRPTTPTVQRACAACTAEEERILRKQAPGQTGTHAVAGDAPPFGLAGQGQPLPQAARQYFELRFGRDLGDVRTHTDTAANQSAQAFNSLAYTFGRHIVFAQGQFAPESDRGRRLLAHELAHVVQQSLLHRPMLARQLAPTPGYTEEQDRMLNCMVRAQRPAAGVVTCKEAFDICAKSLDYRGELFCPTEDDRRQIEQGVLVSAEDLRNYADALKQYHDWLRAGRVSLADQLDIDWRIDFCERLLKTLNLEASADEAAARQARAELSAAPAVGAAIPAVAAVVPTPSVSTTLAQNAANWGASAEELAAPAEWAAGTTETAIVTSTTEAGVAAATGETVAAGVAVGAAAVVLTVAEIALATYLSYRLWKWTWARAGRIVRTQPEVPDTIRDITGRLHRITPLEPTPEPRIEPRLREDPRRRRRRRCGAPTGITRDDPIPMTWFKPREDAFYIPHVYLLNGLWILDRDDPNAILPDRYRTRVGVIEENWPVIGKTMQLTIPVRLGGQARFNEALRSFGYRSRGKGGEQTDADHVQDLQWGGDDDFGNLWPLESSMNQSVGPLQNQHQPVTFCLTENDRSPRTWTIQQIKDRNLYLRWFEIRRVLSAPP